MCCLAGAFPADFPLTCSGGVFWLAGCLTPRTNEGTRARDSGTLPGERDDDGTLKIELLLPTFIITSYSHFCFWSRWWRGRRLLVWVHRDITAYTNDYHDLQLLLVKATKRILGLEPVLAFEYTYLTTHTRPCCRALSSGHSDGWHIKKMLAMSAPAAVARNSRPANCPPPRPFKKAEERPLLEKRITMQNQSP